MFGFSDADLNVFLVLNHFFFLFKHFIYISRDSIILLSLRFFRHLQKVYIIEQKISQKNERKKKLFHENGKKFRLSYSLLKMPVT